MVFATYAHIKTVSVHFQHVVKKMSLPEAVYIIIMSRENTPKTKAMAGTKLLVLCVVVFCLKLQQGQAHGKEHNYLMTTKM